MLKKRLMPFGVLAFMFASLVVVTIAACSSDDESTSTPDAGSETSTSTPEGSTGQDTGADSPATEDGGVDAPITDADAALPVLCVTYPNNPADATIAETNYRNLYELIAYRAIFAAQASCEIGQHFVDPEQPPVEQLRCYANQLRALAGCKVAGQAIDYKSTADNNGVTCGPTDGAASVQLGFQIPPSTYTANDVDFFAALTRTAALDAGLPPAAADQLKAAILAQKTTVSDGGDAGFSMSICP